MSNAFDNLMQKAFDVTTNIMGYDAIWTPSNGGAQQTGRVHYRQPNEQDQLTNGIQYMPFVFIMEYKAGVFQGLQESVRQGTVESVVVNGATHVVRSVVSIVDGQTYEAQLEKITS